MNAYPLTRRECIVSAVSFPLVAIAGLVYLLGTSWEWQGVWTQTGQYIRNVILLAGPIIVAVACWFGGTERRNGLSALAATSAVPSWRRHAAPIVLCSLPALVGYTCVVAVAFVRTGTLSGFVGNSLIFTAIGYASVVAFVLVGYALGNYFPWRLLPLGMVVAAYGAMAYFSSSNTFTNLQPIDTRDVTAARIPGFLGLVWCAWFLGVALLALAVVCRWRIAIVGTAVLAVVCAAVLISRPGFPYRRDPAAEAVTCTDQGVSVCVAQVHHYLTDDIRTAVEASRVPLLGTGLAPTAYRETISGATGRQGGTVVFAPTNGRLVGSASVTRPAMIDELATITFDPAMCPAQGDSYRATATDVINTWYRQRLGLVPFTAVDPEDATATARFNALVTAFAGLPEATRQGWLTAHADGILHCSLPITSVP